MFNRLNYELYEILQAFMSMIPGSLGILLRRLFYKIYLNKCGRKVKIGMHVRIQTPSSVEFGDMVGLNDYIWIAANSNHDGKIIIGNNTIIGPYTIIHSGNHKYNRIDIPIIDQGFTFSSIIIEDDVWLGANVKVLSGVLIEKGSVVAAGAVVNKNIQRYSVVGGVPAKLIKKRLNENS